MPIPLRNLSPNIMVVFLFFLGTSWAEAPKFQLNVRDYGAAGDARADDREPFQKALDAAASQGGGVVLVPAGTYRVEGSLKVPSGVTLQGIWETPHHEDQTWGSALFAVSGRDEPDGAPFIDLSPSSAVRGLKIFYPDQKMSDIRPYPYAIRGSGMEFAVENVTLVNAYQGIDCSPGHELHNIRNVHGCVLRQGIIVDRCTDIGRIENVHFNPHFWARCVTPPGEAASFSPQDWQSLVDYLNENLEVFIFARSDWEYVLNTFAWGFKICYKFIERGDGACNGNFLGIGADGGQHCLWVEKTQPPGLLITNGQFVAFAGKNPIEIVTTPEFRGVVQLSNCSFWGPTRQCVLQQGKGVLSLNQCNFREWGLGDPSVPAVEVTGGELTVSGCLFAKDQAHIRVGEKAGQAIIFGNRYAGQEKVEILNNK